MLTLQALFSKLFAPLLSSAQGDKPFQESYKNALAKAKNPRQGVKALKSCNFNFVLAKQPAFKGLRAQV
jgi:hypothetical protein